KCICARSALASSSNALYCALRRTSGRRNISGLPKLRLLILGPEQRKRRGEHSLHLAELALQLGNLAIAFDELAFDVGEPSLDCRCEDIDCFSEFVVGGGITGEHLRTQ